MESSSVYLATERLILRRLTEADADNLFELDSDPEVMRYLTGGIPHTREEIVDRVLPRFLGYYERYRQYGFWAAIERTSGEFLGWFHFRPYRNAPEEIELGYRLKRSAWGKGYATEGSRALIKKGFTEFGVGKIVADTLAGNVRSRRVMEAVGMKLEQAFVCDPDEFPAWSEEERRGVKYAISRVQWEAGAQRLDNGLAGGADEAGRAAGFDLLDRRSACRARLSLAVPDEQVVGRESAALAVKVYLVPRPALLDASREFNLNGFVKAFYVGACECWDRSQRVKAGAKQDVVHVGISDAGDLRLVEKERLDSTAPVGEQAVKLIVRKIERVRSQLSRLLVLSQPIGFHVVHISEPPEVGRESHFVVQIELHPPLLRQSIARNEKQLTAHPHVDQQMPLACRDEQPLAVVCHPPDLRADQSGPERLNRNIEALWLQHLDRLDPPAGKRLIHLPCTTDNLR